MRLTWLWIAFALVIVGFFAVLGYCGAETYRVAPPVPEQVVTADGRTLFEGQHIKDGQNVWQSIGGQGGQEVGSIWGHSAYVAPDWSADWLYRESLWLLGHWATDDHGGRFKTLDDAQKAQLPIRLRGEMRTNTYDPKTGAIVERGFWYVRSAEFLQTETMDILRWLRVIGDTIFAIGTVALGWFVVGLKTGWSVSDQKDLENLADAAKEPPASPQITGSESQLRC